MPLVNIIRIRQSRDFVDIADGMMSDRIIVEVKFKELHSQLMTVNNLTTAKPTDICRVWKRTFSQC